MTSEPSSAATMIICPTTHNDWDWQVTFAEYYNKGDSGTEPVSGILGSVTTIFSEDPATELCFSYAEVGYLRQYLADNSAMTSVLQAAGSQFCLLGGGITSPDNQACHGEVFIRNYLTGHEYLRSVGLIGNVFFVAWLPDDFGHDPQLPVLIEALGMNAIALSRIPGSPQPTLCPLKQHANHDVRRNGLSFFWPGNDGSSVLTHFMPSTYYGITNGLSNSEMLSATGIQSGMQTFLDDNADAVWPGGTIFATEGGDWQFPTNSSSGGSNAGAYDWADTNNVPLSSGSISVVSQLGTFADYYNALMGVQSEIPSLVLYAENYWTGYFASRPQLKIDHYRSAQLLIGAEVLASILSVYSGTRPEELIELAEAIASGWTLLVPTTHHDFVTGTSPDSVYRVTDPQYQGWDSHGQLAMSQETVALAEHAMNVAMRQLRQVVTDSSAVNEIPVVVFNQTGCDLPDTAIVEMADPSGGRNDFEIRVGASVGPVQRSADNTLLFQVPGMQSMSYRVVYLVPLETVTPPMTPERAQPETVLSNDGLLRLVLSDNASWAITRLEIGGKNHVKDDGTFANRIGIWTDYGNLYQFGMEFMNDCYEGTFTFDSFLTAQTGWTIEKGPIRWRFFGNLVDDASGNTYRTQYDLIRGETLVRITTTGAAPAASTGEGWSVLTSFSMQTADKQRANVLEYGTSYYWENRDPQKSWSGLTFRACRNFAQLATGSEAVAAVYHNGIPAWTIDDGTLRGCLLRNATGEQRGAYGTDTDTHTQSYTLDVAGQLASTGYPLRAALYAQTPLQAVEVAVDTRATMRESAQLASVAQSDAVLRVAKMNPPSDTDNRNLILRVQQARTGAQRLDIDLPFLSSGGTIVWPTIVTALETTPANPPHVTLADTTASFHADRALWTMKVPVTPPATRVE